MSTVSQNTVDRVTKYSKNDTGELRSALATMSVRRRGLFGLGLIQDPDDLCLRESRFLHLSLLG